MFYKRWLSACTNLKIEGLDLYAGTGHTSITEIARRYGENKAIKTSGHDTNKAFERYCRVQDHTALEMAKARAETVKAVFRRSSPINEPFFCRPKQPLSARRYCHKP
jgi:hypothetical protein